MRYRLRTLLIAAAVAPPILAVVLYYAIWLFAVVDYMNDPSRTVSA